MKKLIAIDLDGTLLSSTIDISNENIEAIQQAQNEGHIVMICSGRAPEDIKKVMKKTPLKCPLAGSNGTVVMADGKLLSQISISKEKVSQVASILNEKKFPYKIYTNKGIYIPKSWSEHIKMIFENNENIKDKLTPTEYKLITEQPKEIESVKFIDHIENVLQTEDLSIQKFFVLTLDGKEGLISILDEVEGVSITTSGPLNIEIMDAFGHKGNGVKVMAEHFQIPIENTVAIGDNYNDVPMLEMAGLSIAMGNADPFVKSISNVTTLSNNEHGVAHAIRKYVLQRD